MSSRAPFFEPPLPQPDESAEPRRFANHPWSPPINVVPVVVPVQSDVVATDVVVVRVADIEAFDRGMLVSIEGWLHPSAASLVSGDYGMQIGPRVGLLLPGGTKLGAGEPGHSPDVAPVEAGTPEHPGFVLSGGSSGELRVSQSFWVHPIPQGDAELVISWAVLDVPETYLPLDLDAVRTASGGARELWPLPDATESDMGWFAYAPGGHAAYTSGLSLEFDGDGDGDADAGDDGDAHDEEK